MDQLFPTQGSFPINSEGPENFYPPVCNQFHFDPTLMIKHTLPEENYNICLVLWY